MIAQYNRISMAVGVPGLILQGIGQTYQQPLITLVGTAALIFGLCYYAKSKGLPWALGFLGFLSLLGLIILGLMPDRAKDASPVQTNPNRS